jgi:hypothetical protein
MSLIEVATVIGNVLTQIDITLQTPGLADPDWQTLYALRKHLDDEQRDLIRESIEEENDEYQALTTQLNNASAQLKTVIGDFSKVATTISIISQIASYADQILKLV